MYEDNPKVSSTSKPIKSEHLPKLLTNSLPGFTIVEMSLIREAKVGNIQEKKQEGLRIGLSDWQQDFSWVKPEKFEQFGLSYVEKERRDIENNSLREQHFYFGSVGNEMKFGPEFSQEDYENSVGVDVHWKFYSGKTIVSINKAINNFTPAQRALAIIYAAKLATHPDHLPLFEINKSVSSDFREEILAFLKEMASDKPSIIRTLQRVYRSLVLPKLYDNPRTI